MSNVQLYEEVIARATASIRAKERSAASTFRNIGEAFSAAGHDALKETLGSPEENGAFSERTVGNFILLAAEDGFSAAEIREFIAGLKGRNRDH